jgi:hypothetical protein
MTYLQLALDLLRLVVSWPVVVFTLGIYFMRKFQQPLANLLSSKNLKMQGPGFTLEVAGSQQLSAAESTIAKPDELATTETTVSQAIAVQTTTIEATRNESAEERHVRENPAEVIRTYKTTYNAYMFERALNVIFGSQIRILEHLLSKGEEGEMYTALKPFYDEYWAGNPEATFDKYLGWLQNFGGFIRSQGDPVRVYITPYGAEFLAYIKQNYSMSFLFAVRLF